MALPVPPASRIVPPDEAARVQQRVVTHGKARAVIDEGARVSTNRGRETAMVQPVVAVLVADEDRLGSDALSAALAQCPALKPADRRPHTGSELASAVRETSPDVALIGDPLSDMDGPAATRAALAAKPDLKVLLLGRECQPERVQEALGAGAVGFLPRSLDVVTVAEGIRRAYAGEGLVFEEQLERLLHLVEGRGQRMNEMAERVAGLSPRQFEVLRLMGTGLTAQQMGRHLGVSERTVRNHIQTTLAKLDVRSQVEAVAVARDLGALR